MLKPSPRKLPVAPALMLVSVVGVAVFLWIHYERGPRFEGKPMSYWLKAFRDTRQQDDSGAGLYGSYAKAHNALLKLGTDAAPAVAKGLDGKATAFQDWYQKAYYSLPFGPGVRGVVAGTATRRGFWSRVLPVPRDRPMVKYRSFRLLMEMGSEASTATPLLIRLLESDDDTASYAVGVLGSIGPPAESAVPALIQGLHSPNQGFRESCAIVLGKIGRRPELAVPALLAAMRDNRISVFTAVRSLHKLGYKAKEAVPFLTDRLRETLDSSDGSGIGGICECLADIGEDAADAVPLLIRSLTVKEPRAKAKAAFALSRIGPRASDAVPALTECLREEWWYVRENAASALAGIGPDSREASVVLTQLLEDVNQDVRAAARQALQSINHGNREDPKSHGADWKK